MILSDIKEKLANGNIKEDEYNEVILALTNLKRLAVACNNQAEAKEIWVFEQITKIRTQYLKTFELLKSGSYYDAWCLLERIEIDIKCLKRHYWNSTGEYRLNFIEKAVYAFQTIYPYRFFFSSVILREEKKCSICNGIIDVNAPCGHKVGEIYNGEDCMRIITKPKLLGVDIVENPVHKSCVMFHVGDDGTQKDLYNYTAIEYLMKLINSPYETWDLEVQYQFIPHTQFSEYSKEDRCPCGSLQNYKDCCLKEAGVKTLSFEFIVKHPSDKKILTRTMKTPKANEGK